jgi:4-hydroxy-2-oxoheptanedioate aldolase
VQAAIADAARRIAAAGKPSGILTLNADEAHRFIEWGYSFVAVGGDVALLSEGARALARRFKPNA